ncbi:MAG: DUF3710 domain-containing protein [Gordonia sp. (in: high G+C Gram-positive bacteria)]
MADRDTAARDGLRVGQELGPYDIDELETSAADLENSHLDLGSVLVPVVEGGQVTVEMSADHQPEAVYLVTPHGRVSVTAFAAPKSPGLWREVVRELAASLRDGGASTVVEDGHWGREVVAQVAGATHRFIGVDGPRWMVRCVASSPPETAPELAQLARAVLAESVVRRGKEPVPPREMLPIVLPPVLAEQVAAAQQQMFGADGTAPAPAVAATPAESVPAAPVPDDAVEAERVPGGALDQIEHATVFRDDPDAPDELPVDASEPEPDLPPSDGSAMQRLRRRFSR